MVKKKSLVLEVRSLMLDKEDRIGLKLVVDSVSDLTVSLNPRAASMSRGSKCLFCNLAKATGFP